MLFTTIIIFVLFWLHVAASSIPHSSTYLILRMFYVRAYPFSWLRTKSNLFQWYWPVIFKNERHKISFWELFSSMGIRGRLIYFAYKVGIALWLGQSKKGLFRHISPYSNNAIYMLSCYWFTVDFFWIGFLPLKITVLPFLGQPKHFTFREIVLGSIQDLP